MFDEYQQIGARHAMQKDIWNHSGVPFSALMYGVDFSIPICDQGNMFYEFHGLIWTLGDLLKESTAEILRTDV